VISNLTGRPAEELTDPEYWWACAGAVRSPMGVGALLERGVDAVVESGPRRLSGAVTGIAPTGRSRSRRWPGRGTSQRRAHRTGRRGSPAWNIAWADMFAVMAPRRVDLPTYASSHEHYWPRREGPSGRRDRGLVPYEFGWVPTEPPAAPAADASWLIVVDAGGRADAEPLCGYSPRAWLSSWGGGDRAAVLSGMDQLAPA